MWKWKEKIWLRKARFSIPRYHITNSLPPRPLPSFALLNVILLEVYDFWWLKRGFNLRCEWKLIQTESNGATSWTIWVNLTRWVLFTIFSIHVFLVYMLFPPSKPSISFRLIFKSNMSISNKIAFSIMYTKTVTFAKLVFSSQIFPRSLHAQEAFGW